jgi:hypothetical protein
MRERFAEWVKYMGSAQAAADELSKHTRGGCSGSMVTKVAAGLRRPGLDLVFAIEMATSDWVGGQMKAVEWSDAVETAEGG